MKHPQHQKSVNLLCTLLIVSVISGLNFRQILYSATQSTMLATNTPFFNNAYIIGITLACDAIGALLANTFSPALMSRKGTAKSIQYLIYLSISGDMVTCMGIAMHHFWAVLLGSLCFGMSKSLFTIGFTLAAEQNQNKTQAAKSLKRLEIAIGIATGLLPVISMLFTLNTHQSSWLIYTPFLLILLINLTSLKLSNTLKTITTSSPKPQNLHFYIRDTHRTLLNIFKTPHAFFNLTLAWLLFAQTDYLFSISASLLHYWRIPPQHYTAILSTNGLAIGLSACLLMPQLQNQKRRATLALSLTWLLALPSLSIAVFKSSIGLGMFHFVVSICNPVLINTLRINIANHSDPAHKRQHLASFGIAQTTAGIIATIVATLISHYWPEGATLPCMLIMACYLIISQTQRSRRQYPASLKPTQGY